MLGGRWRLAGTVNPPPGLLWNTFFQEKNLFKNDDALLCLFKNVASEFFSLSSSRDCESFMPTLLRETQESTLTFEVCFRSSSQ